MYQVGFVGDDGVDFSAGMTLTERPGLSAPQAAMLQAIYTHWTARAVTPLLSELADILGISRTTAWYQLRMLEEKGYLSRGHRSRAAIRLTPLGLRAAADVAKD